MLFYSKATLPKKEAAFQENQCSIELSSAELALQLRPLLAAITKTAHRAMTAPLGSHEPRAALRTAVHISLVACGCAHVPSRNMGGLVVVPWKLLAAPRARHAPHIIVYAHAASATNHLFTPL